MSYTIDSKILDFSKNGYGITLEVSPDYDCKPNKDIEGYTPKQVEAWNDNEWQFVTLRIVASRAGIELGDAYLGGLEYGIIPITTEDDEVVDTAYIDVDDIAKNWGNYIADQVDEAIESAESKLRELNGVN